jgi:hypothetical protein
MVSEGIASYYQFDGAEPEDPGGFRRLDAITTPYLLQKLCYEVGHKMVYPIICKYGDKGIEWMIKNPMLPEEILKHKEYTQRALDGLKE